MSCCHCDHAMLHTVCFSYILSSIDDQNLLRSKTILHARRNKSTTGWRIKACHANFHWCRLGGVRLWGNTCSQKCLLPFRCTNAFQARVPSDFVLSGGNLSASIKLLLNPRLLGSKMDTYSTICHSKPAKTSQACRLPGELVFGLSYQVCCWEKWWNCSFWCFSPLISVPFCFGNTWQDIYVVCWFYST